MKTSVFYTRKHDRTIGRANESFREPQQMKLHPFGVSGKRIWCQKGVFCEWNVRRGKMSKDLTKWGKLVKKNAVEAPGVEPGTFSRSKYLMCIFANEMSYQLDQAPRI
jgi:hypothetical protein